jgi:hypothetical protein
MGDFSKFDAEDKKVVLLAEEMDQLRALVARQDINGITDFVLNKCYGRPWIDSRPRPANTVPVSTPDPLPGSVVAARQRESQSAEYQSGSWSWHRNPARGETTDWPGPGVTPGVGNANPTARPYVAPTAAARPAQPADLKKLGFTDEQIARMKK